MAVLKLTRDEFENQIAVVAASKDTWVTIYNDEDQVEDSYFEEIENLLEQFPKLQILFTRKVFIQNHKVVPFAEGSTMKDGFLDEKKLIDCHAYFLEGTFIRTELLEKFAEGKEQITDFEISRFLLEIQQEYVDDQGVYFYGQAAFGVGKSYEGDKVFCENVYQKAWYEKEVADNWYTWLRDLKQTKHRVPLLYQYHAAFVLNFCIDANLNNLNKRLFTENEAKELLLKMGLVFSCLEDMTILSKKHFPIEGKNDSLRRWTYLILKYQNPDLKLDFYEEPDGIYYGFHNIACGKIDEITVDIQYMSYENGILHVDGRSSPIAWMHNRNLLVKKNHEIIKVKKNERYALTKAFGFSLYKLQSFEVDIPIVRGKDTKWGFYMDTPLGTLPVSLEFDSHFSRITNRFPHNYWRMDRHTLMHVEKTSFVARKKKFGSVLSLELGLWKDMLKTKDKKVIKYIPVRLFLLMKPLLKHKPIWLFWDKIYKAGDSAEYLYHYARKQKDGIMKYYLLDQHTPDYRRMVKEGDKPLIRHSLAHRMKFLYADKVIISNSTVYAFNDFSTKNSGYIRDLMNFDVVCVQHGMSVQKIAVAQNRLRDNIRLYFCASPYEIENLSKPIYDYAGRDILKLTGVPRYDGLVSCDKKQILISPTWRMQAAVPVTKNESVERDYNPMFKETSYYQVYNQLINNEKLIEAAKQYGYKILYVLHPIVSAQAKDFDRNDYVEIIPSTGDMSYEKVLCESSLMVTDYSGVQYDFAYMKKPLLYLHHRDIPQHYEEGTFHYDTMAFGEICHDNEELIGLLIEYMANQCQMKDVYRKRVEDFFAFSDHENCARIYQIMRQTKKPNEPQSYPQN